MLGGESTAAKIEMAAYPAGGSAIAQLQPHGPGVENRVPVSERAGGPFHEPAHQPATTSTSASPRVDRP